jgi:hypothetical protein
LQSPSPPRTQSCSYLHCTSECSPTQASPSLCHGHIYQLTHPNHSPRAQPPKPASSQFPLAAPTCPLHGWQDGGVVARGHSHSQTSLCNSSQKHGSLHPSHRALHPTCLALVSTKGFDPLNFPFHSYLWNPS